MMLAMLALKTGLPQRVIAGIGIVLLIGAAILTFRAWVADGKRDAVEADRLKSRAVAVERQSKAQEQAAVERVNDQRANQELEKELTDAVKNLPDAMPSARRVARACARLRSQGTDTAALPQCRGPQARSQAVPGPGGAGQ